MERAESPNKVKGKREREKKKGQTNSNLYSIEIRNSFNVDEGTNKNSENGKEERNWTYACEVKCEETINLAK